MKKIIPLLIIIIILGVGFKIYHRRRQLINPNLSQSEKDQKSILDWIKSGTGVRCQLEENGQQVTVLAKGNKVKIIGENLPLGNQVKKGNLINDGQWIYIWTDQEQQGLKYPLSQEEGENETNESTEPFSLEKWTAQWEQYRYSCQPAKINDQEFVPPQEIKFIDFANLINQFQETVKEATKNGENVEDKIRELQEKLKMGQ